MDRANPDEVFLGLSTIVTSGSVAELRVLQAGTSGTVSGYFDDVERMAAEAARLSGKGLGVYVTLNPVRPDLLARAANRMQPRARHATADADIDRRTWILLDVDPVRPTGISSTDGEHQAALQRVEAVAEFLVGELQCPEEALVVLDSGNGGHALLRVDLANDAQAQRLVTQCLRSLSLLFSDDHVVIDAAVGNASRLAKVPGTLAAKGDSLPNRPHRLSRVLKVPPVVGVCGIEVLRALATLSSESSERAAGGRSASWRTEGLQALLLETGFTVSRTKRWGNGTLLQLASCPWNPDHVDTARVIIFESGAVSAGCFHNSCQGRGWQDLKPLLTGDAAQALKHATPLMPRAAPPEPLWKPRDLLTAEERDAAEALDSFPRRFAAYAARRTDAPGSFLEAAGYAILSVAVGRKPKLRLSIGTVIAAVWVMLVADSTRMRKSTVINLATEVLARSELDVLAPDDFSPQRLITLMAERSGKPTLFRRDEFGGFLEGLNKLEHQAGGKQILIAMYDGRDYHKELQGVKVIDKETGDPKRRPEVIDVKDPFLSVLAGTQHDLFLSQAQHGDVFSGFLPRFSFIVPAIAPERRDIEAYTPALETELNSLSYELRGLSAQSARTLRAEPDALARWNRYQQELEEEADRAPIPSIAGPVFARHGITALKLALLLSFTEQRDSIELQHMLAGMEAADRWRAQSFNLLSRIGPTREEKLFEKVAALVQRKPGVLRGAIMSSLRLSARDMDRARETLTQRGWIDVEQRARGEAYWPHAEPALAMLEPLSRGGEKAQSHESLDQPDPERSRGSVKDSRTARTQSHPGTGASGGEGEPSDDVGVV